MGLVPQGEFCRPFQEPACSGYSEHGIEQGRRREPARGSELCASAGRKQAGPPQIRQALRPSMAAAKFSMNGSASPLVDCPWLHWDVPSLSINEADMFTHPEVRPTIGRPFVECHCSGGPREMGLAQGNQLGEKIRQTPAALRHLEALRLQQPAWLPFSLFLELAECKAAKALVPVLREAHPGMLARLEGVAEGAGVPLRRVCFLNAMEAFLCSVEGRTVAPPLGACSALAVRGSASRGAEPIIARNFDYPSVFQPFYTLRESRPKGGFRSLDFLVAPQAGTIDGVNEKGLAITIDYAFVVEPARPNPLVTMAISDALATCATVAEAARRLTASPRWGAGLLMLADASGDIASVELSNTRSGVRRPANGTDWLLCTNVCLCPETQAVQVSRSACYSDECPTPLRGTAVLQPHFDRARRIENLLGEHGSLGPQELAAIMADHGEGGVPGATSPCVHTQYFNTTACFQWFPARRSVRVSYSAACRAQYVEISL